MENKISASLRWPPKLFESFLDLLPPSLQRKLTIAQAAIAGVAIGGDIFVHYPAGLSDPGRRAIAESLFGKEITSHLGNTTISFAIMSAFILTAEQVASAGEKYDSELLKVIAEWLPMLGFLSVIGLNIAETKLSNQPNPQGVGDSIFGIASALAAGTIFTQAHRNEPSTHQSS